MLYIILLFCLLLIEPSWSRLDLEDSDMTDPSLNNNCITGHCFHKPINECPEPGSKCPCRQLPNCPTAAVCCNIKKFQLTEDLACANFSANSNIEALHIRNATLDVLDLDKWKRLKYLRYMTITDGNITSVKGEFVKHTMISCLNLSSNEIVNFANRSLVNLYNLNFLDLSHNNLTGVPRFKKEGKVILDISANKHIDCSNVYEAFKRTELHFNNENSTYCSEPKSYHWFKDTVFMLLSQIRGVYEVRNNCQKGCSCEPARIYMVPGKSPTYAVAVNCSGLELVSLPRLPPNTISLNVSNNNITSLEMVNSDKTYNSLRELYADNNQITSILPLEGSNFLNNLVALSLRNNKLKSLQSYVFSNVFDRNNNNRVNLGLNKLQCDCNTAKVLKVWLLTKQKSIPDYKEIYCENMDLKVIDLKPSKLCQIQQDWTDYIYYIITAEVFLLVGLIAKVLYDYCVFKSSGYLPWPANKMPKLPCDWLCE